MCSVSNYSKLYAGDIEEKCGINNKAWATECTVGSLTKNGG